jgi:hypothetical protein
LSPATSNISIAGTPAVGTVTVTGGTATYTPNIRIPRWPELMAIDSFTFTGIDGGNSVVSGIVDIVINSSCPTSKFLAVNSNSTTINGVNVLGSGATPTAAAIVGSFAKDGMATNGVDGIVLSSMGGSSLVFWDPVSSLTGMISLGGVMNFSPSIQAISGGSYDNDKGYYWVFSNKNDLGNNIWFYRMSFQPYVTNTTPVINTIDRGRIFTDVALTITYTGSSFGDVAWDPISKRIYMILNNGAFGYVSSTDTMQYVSASPPIFGLLYVPQGTAVGPNSITFNCQGQTMWGQSTGTTTVWSLNRVGNPVVVTSQGSIISGTGATDLATWPPTLLG